MNVVKLIRIRKYYVSQTFKKTKSLGNRTEMDPIGDFEIYEVRHSHTQAHTHTLSIPTLAKYIMCTEEGSYYFTWSPTIQHNFINLYTIFPL